MEGDEAVHIRVAESGGWNTELPKPRLATAFMVGLEHFHAGNAPVKGDALEAYVKKLCDAQAVAARQGTNQGALEVLTLQSPAQLLLLLRLQEDFYQGIQSVTIEDLSKFLVSQEVESLIPPNEDHYKEFRDSKPILFFDKMQAEFTNTPLTTLKETAYTHRRARAEQEAELENQLRHQIERDWSTVELNQFLQESPRGKKTNFGSVHDIESIVKKRQNLTSLIISLDQVEREYTGGGEVAINKRGDIYFSKYSPEALRQSSGEASNMDKSISELNEQITGIKAQARKRWFGVGNKSREEAIGVLEAEKDLLLIRKNVLSELHDDANTQNNKLIDIRKWVASAKESGLTVYPTEGTYVGTLPDLVINFKQTMDTATSLTPAQKELYARYTKLKAAKDLAERNLQPKL